MGVMKFYTFGEKTPVEGRRVVVFKSGCGCGCGCVESGYKFSFSTVIEGEYGLRSFAPLDLWAYES